MVDRAFEVPSQSELQYTGRSYSQSSSKLSAMIKVRAKSLDYTRSVDANDVQKGSTPKNLAEEAATSADHYFESILEEASRCDICDKILSK